MNREQVKTLAIFLISVIFLSNSIEKKKIIDELNSNILLLEEKASIRDSVIKHTTLDVELLNTQLSKYEEKIQEYESGTHKVTVTMYHPVASQTDDTPNVTADGTLIKVKRASNYNYVAVSRNMLVSGGGFLKYGDYVWVDAGKKSGVYQVRDTMATRWVDRIDILESPGVEPYKYTDASIRRINYAQKQL
tara:strand:+ start:98 stop:670 length:573 start_codon:yes stop_codon:yes gene_type:complete